MGIRFYCPNGHKLNVKSFLAGRRGYCPHCGIKFVVPNIEENEQTAGELPVAVAVEPGNVANSGATSTPSSPGGAGPDVGGSHSPRPETQVPQPPDSEATASQHDATGAGTLGDPIAQPSSNQAVAGSDGQVAGVPPNASVHGVSAGAVEAVEIPVWYVLIATGERLGPLPHDEFLSWVRAGRISAEAHVWRSGWANWRAAGTLTSAELAPLPDTSSPQGAMAAQSGPSTAASATLPPVDSRLATGAPSLADNNAASPLFASDEPGRMSQADSAPSKAIILQRRRKKRRRNQMLVGVLAVLAVLLAALLVYVLLFPVGSVE